MLGYMRARKRKDESVQLAHVPDFDTIDLSNFFNIPIYYTIFIIESIFEPFFILDSFLFALLFSLLLCSFDLFHRFSSCSRRRRHRPRSFYPSIFVCLRYFNPTMHLYIWLYSRVFHGWLDDWVWGERAAKLLMLHVHSWPTYIISLSVFVFASPSSHWARPPRRARFILKTYRTKNIYKCTTFY